MTQHARLDPITIPFVDVAAQRRRLGARIDEAIARVTAHCQFIMGPEVFACEADLAAFCGVRHAVAWDGLDDAGNRAASGAYICRMSSGGGTASRKMTLVK